MRALKLRGICFVVLILKLSFLSFAVADEYQDKAYLLESIGSALNLVNSSSQLLNEHKQKMESETNNIDRQMLELEQKRLIDVMVENEKTLSQLVYGDDVLSLNDQEFENKEFNWKNELTEVLKPFVSEIKSLTKVQREKERLKIELEFYGKKITRLQSAYARIEDLYNVKEIDPALKKHINKMKKELSALLETSQSHLRVLKSKRKELDLQRKKQEDLGVQQLHQMLAKIMYHLLLALLVAILVYYLVNVLKVYLNTLQVSHDQRKLFFVRALQFFLRMLSMILAIASYCIVLVVFSEWALLSVSMIVLLGMVLTLRDVLPQYITEMRTILNLGSVREGERVIYKGIPWRVNNLNFYTEIFNDDLNVGFRLPIGEVGELKSRPVLEGERWFPSRIGDYVMLEENVYGQVCQQSPDMVVVNSFGALKHYAVSDFYAAKPVNLSRNTFTLDSNIGIDYKYQCDATTSVLEKMNAFLVNRLKVEVFSEHVIKIRAEFLNAGDSSLNYMIIMQCEGQGASQYYVMERWLQKVGVDCCNQFEWGIPFPQVVLNKA